jgi:diguanylate cyclase (GGDEF)-like protein
MTILVVDDASRDLKTILSEEPQWTVLSAQSSEEALRTMGQGGVDLVLADMMYPSAHGLELCRRIKACPDLCHTPVVMLMSGTEREYVNQLYDAGACDYIMKPLDPVEVVARVRAVLRSKARERQLETRTRELQAANERLLQLSLVDSVTGVANRRHFDDMMDRAWRSAARHEFEIALILMDIDFFKAYNDSLGHPAGDACLRQVASELATGLLRPDDFLARYGGEEFAVILPRTGLPGASVVAERLRSNVESLGIQHPGSPHAGMVTISQGLACAVPTLASEPSVLIAKADEALYEAKRSGRNRLCTRCTHESACPVLWQGNPITGHAI